MVAGAVTPTPGGGAGLTHKGKLNRFLVYMVRSDQEET